MPLPHNWQSPDVEDTARLLAWLRELERGTPAVVHVGAYGAVADCQTVGDGAITSGQATLTSATGRFVAADVGKAINVAGAGTAGDDLRTTISAYTSATTVTVAAAAGGGVSGATVSWGTDNTTPINNALAAVAPSSIGGRQVGGANLVFGQGSYFTTGGHAWPLLVQMEGQGEQATNIIHSGNNSCFTQSGATLVTYGRHGIRNLTIWGNNGTSAVGVEIQGKQWSPYLEHVMVGNYANGIGLLLNNLAAGAFVEGVLLNGFTSRSNLVGIELRRTSGDQSFGYQRWALFDIHVPASGVGILIGDGTNSSATCQVYSAYINGNIWLEGNTAKAVRVGTYGLVDNNTTWIVRGEVSSGSSTKALQLDASSTFYPRGIHDFAVSLTGTQPTMDVANGTYRPPTRTNELLADQGIIREPFGRATAQGATAPTTGVMVASLTELRRGDMVTGIAVGVTANGSTLSLVKVAIWDKSGTLLASSADDNANYTAGSVPRAQKTALSAVYTVPADGSYYIGALFVGTTAPTLVRGANFTGPSVAIGSGVLPHMQSAGGKTDVATTSVNSTGTAFWFAAY